MGAMALHGPHHVAKQSTMTVFWSLTTFLNSSALEAPKVRDQHVKWYQFARRCSSRLDMVDCKGRAAGVEEPL